jgi:hypothetical protein
MKLVRKAQHERDGGRSSGQVIGLMEIEPKDDCDRAYRRMVLSRDGYWKLWRIAKEGKTLEEGIRSWDKMIAASPKWTAIPVDGRESVRTQRDILNAALLAALSDDDSGVETADGCWVEPDGHCPHGYPSPLLAAGLI